ncbi:MAG: sulfotransferase [Acidimicrobiia bacterium]|nr:sulfotransferase [Acidimicrobiia bacterium]
MPWILVSMLSRLADDADALFDETDAVLRSRGEAPVATHYRDLFAWLAERLGGSVWIERSGSSVDYLGDLARLFPDGRFVHLHRDGREAALSIRAHPFYRLAVSLLYDRVPDVDEGEDVVGAMLESMPPVELFGRYWSDQLLSGFAALPRLDRDQYLAVRFEDVVADPGTWMARLADFFALPGDPGFPARAAALVEGAPRSRFGDLAPNEQDRLVEACRPGQMLLGRDPARPPTD